MINQSLPSFHRSKYSAPHCWPDRIIGNKSDCGQERVVKKEDGEQLAQEYKVPFMETSAKTGLNVELAFLAVARYVPTLFLFKKETNK